MTDLMTRRIRRLGPNVPTFYDRPVHLVRGEGLWLWDDTGKRYLDCYNNVPHVGHCHPHVVQAIARQAATLNTHTRYLHTGILDALDRITATLSHGLTQGIMVCTGSEANDIALRMAQAVTGHTGIIATDNTYHGNTTATAQLSTRRPPIGGYPPHVRLVPAPETGADPAAFAADVQAAIKELQSAGYGFSGMMLCPVFANEGLPTLAPGFLDPTVTAIRAAGGLVLCDEVQPGFGRCGQWWGHDWLGIAPDVVTLGKPMGNGHPVAATIATEPVMRAFRTAFGYFNTFGGNPVSAAAVNATLDVIERDDLVTHAAAMGQRALDRMRALSHPAITEIRGNGLFFGAVLMENGHPATDLAIRIVEEMKDRGVLIGRIGRHMNILKMRPPLPISADQIDLAIATLADVLADTPSNG